jgi:hypothetical protein
MDHATWHPGAFKFDVHDSGWPFVIHAKCRRAEVEADPDRPRLAFPWARRVSGCSLVMSHLALLCTGLYSSSLPAAPHVLACLNRQQSAGRQQHGSSSNQPWHRGVELFIHRSGTSQVVCSCCLCNCDVCTRIVLIATLACLVSFACFFSTCLSSFSSDSHQSSMPSPCA